MKYYTHTFEKLCKEIPRGLQKAQLPPKDGWYDLQNHCSIPSNTVQKMERCLPDEQTNDKRG